MIRRMRFLTASAAFLAGLALLVPHPSAAQVIVKAGDNTFFRIGFQLMAWADWQQATAAGGTETDGYAQNLFIRRVRFLLGGQLIKDVTFFYQTDNPNLGKNKTSSTALSSGFVTQDAWVQWKIASEFQLEGGLFLIPFSRDELISTQSFLTLDISPLATVSGTATESSGFRDTGFAANGFLADDHLAYRLAVTQGDRTGGSGEHNSFRYSGRVQYDFFGTETGYTYVGTNRGEKQVVAIGVGSDNQGDYHAYTADAFADIPIGSGEHKDAVTFNLGWYHYDGEDKFTSVPQQNDYLGEAGYYIAAANVQPFIQYETQRYSLSANTKNNSDRYQVGFNYYISGQNLKLTPAYTRVVPKGTGLVSTNEFTIQLVALYW